MRHYFDQFKIPCADIDNAGNTFVIISAGVFHNSNLPYPI